MKVLVTGTQGYIGTELATFLLQKNHDVTGLDTGFYSEGSLYKKKQKSIPHIDKDVRNVTEKDLTGFEAIIHLAELSNDPLGQLDSDLTFKINHEGTVKLAKIAKSVGVKRFVYFSSCSVYGASDQISNEKSSTNPLTAYAKCKVLNEQVLSKMADKNFSPVFLRNATAFGSSPRMRFDLAINNLCGIAWTTGKIAMQSDGSAWRPFVHLLDITEAALCALVAPRDSVHNEIFNVGTREGNYLIKDIAHMISEILPKCEITLNRSMVDKRNYRVDFSKINTKLPGFSGTRSVKRGIKELITLFKKINLTKERFLSKDFTRLKQIEYLKQSGQIDDELFWTR